MAKTITVCEHDRIVSLFEKRNSDPKGAAKKLKCIKMWFALLSCDTQLEIQALNSTSNYAV